MKQTPTNLNAISNVVRRVFFCSQLIVISLAVPSLFYVGISYNNDTAKKQLLSTNKGTKFLATEKEPKETIKYSASVVRM